LPGQGAQDFGSPAARDQRGLGPPDRRRPPRPILATAQAPRGCPRSALTQGRIRTQIRRD
jgi:hypothetical protein